jgi:hypothetical protein
LLLKKIKNNTRMNAYRRRLADRLLMNAAMARIITQNIGRMRNKRALDRKKNISGGIVASLANGYFSD